MALRTEREKGSHLLRRFGLGASQAELDYYLRDGLSGAIDLLLKPVAEDVPDIDPAEFANDKGVVRMPQVVGWWVLRLINSRRPLQERMTLFWHDHFATSASKVNQPGPMFRQNQTLRTYGLGSFRDLLMQVSKDPAMMQWLDNQENVRGKPNENFAREVMELFTLGFNQGYTEHDVQEAARAFTGWGIRRLRDDSPLRGGEFFFRANLHDTGEKTFLGQKGDLSGEDVLNILCDRPRTATYLTHKIWEWFVYPNPDAKTIETFARRFREANLDISALLRDIMQSTEFYSEKAERAVVKNPVDFCVVTLRQLGYGAQFEGAIANIEAERRKRQILGPAVLTGNAMKSMGMWLFYPPDVAGWETGTGWISSATMVERMGWADRIFGNPLPGKPSLRYPAYPLLAADPSVNGIVDRLTSVFDAPVSKERRITLLSAAERALGEGLTPKNANAVAAAVTRLIFATPEFQFA